MKSDLSAPKEIILDFHDGLQKERAAWDRIQELNPDFEQVDDAHWEQAKARRWLHGATDIVEANELERWLNIQLDSGKVAQEPARAWINRWRDCLDTKDPYYELFGEFDLDPPIGDESLQGYLLRLQELVGRNGKGRWVGWRSLKSFLSFLRDSLSKEDGAFIEHIFPAKMDVRHGRVVRKVPDQVHRISTPTAASILEALATIAIDGRSNHQHTAIETLAFCWLCLTASRLRAPTCLKTGIYPWKVASLNQAGDPPTVLVPTLFGDLPICISKRLASFLRAVADIPGAKPRLSILGKPYRSLTRTFDEALKMAGISPDLGPVTPLTFLSPPHPWDADVR